MGFDEMKRIWNAQHVVLDESALAHLVRRRADAEAREASVNEIGLMLIMAFVGLYTAFDAVRDREPIVSYVSSIVSLGIVAYVYAGRRARLRRDHGFGERLSDRVDRGILQLDTQIARLRSFLWWFLLPTTLAALLSLLFKGGQRPLWVWLMQPVALALAYGVIQWDLHRCKLPRRAELVKLRDELGE